MPRWGLFSINLIKAIKMNNLQNNQKADTPPMGYETLLGVVISGCKFKYFSYDHKKAMEEYNSGEEFKEQRKFDINPNSWDMPENLKEKYKVERIGSLREIKFLNGKAFKFKIGAKYPKTYYLEDFGVNVFPLV